MSKLFLSCVTGEFGSHRTLLTKYLHRAKVEVRVQEHFGVGGGTLLQSLDAYIRECDAVVHLIGRDAGVCPEGHAVQVLLANYPDMTAKLPILAEALSRAESQISYTQWEAYLALYHDCDIHVYLPDVDTPREPSQEEHFQRIAALGSHRGTFENEESLSSCVLADLRHILSAEVESFKAEPSTLWKLQTKPDGVFEGRENVLADLNALWDDAIAGKPGRARIVSLVAMGGAGKTTVTSRWKDALLAREDFGGVERYFDWSFYSQGTRREGDNVSVQSAADATVFIAAALKFFGDPAAADSTAPAWDKGAHLATLVARHRTLLILDGLEPLQHPPGPQTGELKDDAIRALLAGLQSDGRGVSIITTREPITDLAATRATTTPEWRLDHLTDVAGALVLKAHGVIGPEDELQQASAEVKGHALTLSLMGRYLRLAFEPPDIARRDTFDFSEADAETQNGHAFRVFAAYERWFEREGRSIEVAILRLLGLFDRPATPDCVLALCANPVISGLTEPLLGLSEKQWNSTLKRLRDLGLVETAEWMPTRVRGYGKDVAERAAEAGRKHLFLDLGPSQLFHAHPPVGMGNTSIDAHPVLREYFDRRLRQSGSASDAHARLYEHLSASVPYWPGDRESLLPLYQAVSHGCRARRFQQACDDVYYSRILRGNTYGQGHYSVKQLGLHGLDLAAVACFFIDPWKLVEPELRHEDQIFLLSEAAVRLRALNRLTEAREPMQVTTEMCAERNAWGPAATAASNLSELELTLGDVPLATTTAIQSVTFADSSGVPVDVISAQIRLGDAYFAAGQFSDAAEVFSSAESDLASLYPAIAWLPGNWGTRFDDLRLSTIERMAWKASLSTPKNLDVNQLLLKLNELSENGVRRLDTDVKNRQPLLDIALDHLTLGRVDLFRAVLESTDSPLYSARTYLDKALAILRQANTSHHFPAALLPNAWLHARAGEWEGARHRIDEALALATRGGKARNGWHGGMRLHLIDVLLYRARLFGMHAEYPWPGRTPKIDLEEASTLIDVCGYHRRDEELLDAMAVFG